MGSLVRRQRRLEKHTAAVPDGVWELRVRPQLGASPAIGPKSVAADVDDHGCALRKKASLCMEGNARRGQAGTPPIASACSVADPGSLTSSTAEDRKPESKMGERLREKSRIPEPECEASLKLAWRATTD
jgi:hypothetical protein